MATVPTSIFRKYDIRGLATGDNIQLSPAVAELVGKALGTYLPQQFGTEHVFVGSDNRLTSPALKAAMIRGLASTGINVTDIGEVLTPTTYYAAASYSGVGAGVMITGSHLTTEYNGIKMAYGRLALAGDQILDLLKIIETDAFATGNGTITEDMQMIYRHMDTLAAKIGKLARPMKVVLDAGNGLSGSYVPAVLEKIGAEVVCLYCEPDGTYPNHLPNPEDPEMTVDLERKVIEVGADLGLAFDGDSDRCGFIDNHGHHIAADRLLALLSRDLLSRHPGASIVFDVKASLALADEIKKYGGVPVMWKSGHSLMKQKMHEIGSLLGGEVSGHLFMGEDYYGFDDAPLVALRSMAIFAKSDQTVAEIFEAIPTLVATPEIILATPDNIKFSIIDEIGATLAASYEVITVDGARAVFPNGWGLVRASNTQPAITLRFEAYTRPQIVEYMAHFRVLLASHPEIDLTKFDQQVEAFSH
ncbi:MAG: phosphomannomutase/phosphoglucomutase [Phototrophicaceae bacterium]|jgi:phosphomannomutase/phosphoglucomutase